MIKNNSIIKRFLSVLVTVAILCSCLMSICVSATGIDELKNKQSELENRSSEYEAILEEKNAKVDKQQEYVDALVGKVETVNEEIQVSHEKISLLDSKIEEKTEQIDKANADIEANMNILRQRIKTIYLAGDVSSLEIILGAKDFSDFLDKCQLVKSVSTHDEQLINDIQVQLDAISEEKEELQIDKLSLEDEEKNLRAKQDELNSLLEENKETLSTLQAASDDAEKQLTLTEDELSNLSDEIQEYYRKQQQAQQQAQQQQSSGGSGSSSNSSVSVDVPSDGGFVWPCPGFYYLSSTYDEWRGAGNHGAIDIAGGGIMGATVVAAQSGIVISTCTGCYHNWGKSYSCGCGGGYGNYVWIDHGNGKQTIYAHLSSVSVSSGQSVSAGQVVGYVGSTGYSTGAHLHFECRYNGVRYNPMSEY